MCNFVSFAVVLTDSDCRIYAGTFLDSHLGIEGGWNLKPGSYR